MYFLVPFWKKGPTIRKKETPFLTLRVLRQTPFKWTFGRLPPPKSTPIWGGAVFLFCISIENVNWKKFLRWKLLDNICSSEVKQNHQTKIYTCEFENFSDKFFPIFGRIETFLVVFVITFLVVKVTKVHVDAILRKKMKDTNQKMFTELQ